jgi:hypothetical protein
MGKALNGLVLGAVILAACGSNSSDEGSPQPHSCARLMPDFPEAEPMDEATFVSSYVKEYCDGLEACCGAAQLTFDRTVCEARAVARINAQKGTGYPFDPVQGTECMRNVRFFATRCPTNGTFTLLFPDAMCRDLYHGTVPDGSACTAHADCAVPPLGSSSCLKSSTGGLECVATSNDLQPGAECAPPGVGQTHFCVEGYACDEVTRTCVPECFGVEGAPCDFDSSCGWPLDCNRTSQRCTQPGPIGASCTDDDECLGGACDQGNCALDLTPEACFGL